MSADDKEPRTNPLAEELGIDVDDADYSLRRERDFDATHGARACRICGAAVSGYEVGRVFDERGIAHAHCAKKDRGW